MRRKYDVAAFVYPAYSGHDKRARVFWPEGIGEWETVQHGPRSWEDAYRLRKPMWGYVNEADPFVMEMEIEAATRHGVNVFIYDWYWYDNRPYLEDSLNDGFLKAANRDKMKFYLMWANHEAGIAWDNRNAGFVDEYLWDGAADFETFKTITARLIDKYFKQPTYYTIDGKPVFAIYELGHLVRGLGGLENTKKAMNYMREECIKAGLPGIHYQLILQYPEVPNFSGLDGKAMSFADAAGVLDFDSATHYQFVHMFNCSRPYADVLKDVKGIYDLETAPDKPPYFPHVSIGWDNNLRFKTPNNNITTNNEPAEVKKGFQMAKEYLDAHPDQVPLVTVNSWNEWTETSYLQPDYLYGYGYLEAVRDVFLGEE